MDAKPNTFTLWHYECEHTGDLERDHRDLRAAGLTFTVKLARPCHNTEQGAGVITTTATAAEVKAAAKETCVSTVYHGDKSDELIAEAEGEAEDEDDDY